MLEKGENGEESGEVPEAPLEDEIHWLSDRGAFGVTVHQTAIGNV